MVEMPLEELEPEAVFTDDQPGDTAVETEKTSSPPAGLPCPHCEQPTFTPGAQWCSACGFYPRLNIFVEPDPVVDPADARGSLPWYEEIPPWAWKLSAGLLVLAAIALGCRLATPDDGPLRMICALAMLGAGAVSVLVAHGLSYAHAVFADAQTGMFDLFTRPIRVWLPTIRDFPQTFNRVAAASWGLGGMFLAMAVIGGIPYSVLWDWGGEPPKQNLVKAITAQGIEAGEADGDLEGAIEDFASQAAVTEGDDEEKEPTPPPNPRKLAVDCVIVGYTPLGDDDFDSLVVATDVDGQLRIVALVSQGISPEVRAELNRRMRELPRARPFIETNISARWVQPKLLCRVRFREWSSTKRLRSPEFETQLNELR